MTRKGKRGKLISAAGSGFSGFDVEVLDVVRFEREDFEEESE